ncbi:MAG: HEPN domain-containing protein [Acidimicrobiales bacterium]
MPSSSPVSLYTSWSMTPRGKAARAASPADARAYLLKAQTWLGAAQDALTAKRWDVAAGSAVTAGINACDALAAALLGERPQGEHHDATTLLSQAGARGKAAASQLAQLLRYKTPAQYDPTPTPQAKARKAVDLAERLVRRAAMLLE